MDSVTILIEFIFLICHALLLTNAVQIFKPIKPQNATNISIVNGIDMTRLNDSHVHTNGSQAADSVQSFYDYLIGQSPRRSYIGRSPYIEEYTGGNNLYNGYEDYIDDYNNNYEYDNQRMPIGFRPPIVPPYPPPFIAPTIYEPIPDTNYRPYRFASPSSTIHKSRWNGPTVQYIPSPPNRFRLEPPQPLPFFNNYQPPATAFPQSILPATVYPQSIPLPPSNMIDSLAQHYVSQPRFGENAQYQQIPQPMRPVFDNIRPPSQTNHNLPDVSSIDGGCGRSGRCGNICCWSKLPMQLSPSTSSPPPPTPPIQWIPQPAVVPSRQQSSMRRKELLSRRIPCRPDCMPTCSRLCLAESAPIPLCRPACMPACLPSCTSGNVGGGGGCRPVCMPRCLPACVAGPPLMMQCGFPCLCTAGYIQCSPMTCCIRYRSMAVKYRDQLPQLVFHDVMNDAISENEIIHDLPRNGTVIFDIDRNTTEIVYNDEYDGPMFDDAGRLNPDRRLLAHRDDANVDAILTSHADDPIEQQLDTTNHHHQKSRRLIDIVGNLYLDTDGNKSEKLFTIVTSSSMVDAR